MGTWNLKEEAWAKYALGRNESKTWDHWVIEDGVLSVDLFQWFLCISSQDCWRINFWLVQARHFSFVYFHFISFPIFIGNHYSIIQNGFTALNIPYAPPTYPSRLATTDLFIISIACLLAQNFISLEPDLKKKLALFSFQLVPQ